MQQQIKQEWDKVADKFTNAQDPFEFESRTFIDDVILEEIEDYKDKKILDIGSGNGDFSFKVHDKGAEVVGLELSDEMKKSAENKYPMLNFFTHDLSISPFDTKDKYDYVVMELVMMFVKDVDNLLLNTKDLLRPEGELVVAILHPFFVLASSAGEDSELKFEDMDNYFVEQVLKLKSDDVDLTYFSRSVSWYIKKFVENGFILTDLSEPSLSEGIVNMKPRYTSIKHIPYIMLMKFKLK